MSSLSIKKLSFAFSFSSLLIGLYFYPTILRADDCYYEERYCTEWLNDGKCKLWDYKKIEVPCPEPEMCTEVRQICLNDDCSRWRFEEYEAPCQV